MIKPRIHFDGVLWVCQRNSADWAQGWGESPVSAYNSYRYMRENG